MPQPQPQPQPQTRAQHELIRFLIADSPYIIMLAMGLLGIGYRAFVGHPIMAYWFFLTPVFAVLCLIAGFRHTRNKQEGVDLVWTQVLHWGAFLVAMYLVTVGTVRSTLDDNAVGLLQLSILALAVFLAGVHAHSWRLSVVGIVLGLAVPAVAWVNQSAVFIGMIATVVVIVVAVLWFTQRRYARRAAA